MEAGERRRKWRDKGVGGWVKGGGGAIELGEATRGVRGESEEGGVRQNETQEVN